MGTVIGRDDFTGTSQSDLTAHTPTWTVDGNPAAGTGWAKITGFTGSLLISAAGHVRQYNGSSLPLYKLLGAVDTADVDVQADESRINTLRGVMIAARIQANGDHYFAGYDGANLIIGKRVGGTDTTLGSITAPGAVAPGRYVLSLRGTSLTLTYNGATEVTVTDAAITAAGANGFRGVTSAASTDTSRTLLDNLIVTSFDNILPANTVAPALSGTNAVGQVLTCSQGTWTGSPTSYAFQWLRDGAAISGATLSTYTVQSADAGHSLSCTVTATNGSGSTSATSNTATIPSPPANTVLPAISGGTGGLYHTGDVVTCSQGTWTNSPTSYAFQWYRGASPITGATANTYTLVTSDEGANISCAVTATNGGGSATASSAAIVPQVTAAISDASFLEYYSGGVGNTDPALSIGGARGGTFPGGVDLLFADVPGSVAAAGGTFYRAVYIRNGHTTSSVLAMAAYVLQQFAFPGLTLAVGVPVEAKNVALPTLASQTTAPAGVTFTTAATAAAGEAFGDLGPGDFRGLWLQLTVAPGTTPTSEADALYRVEGSAS